MTTVAKLTLLLNIPTPPLIFSLSPPPPPFLSVSSHSPLSSPLSLSLQCVPQTDTEVLTALMPKIVEILKTGVGFGTKVRMGVILTISL